MVVWEHFHTFGRHSLPWRKTKDAYKILVSELMLQQTQVQRVLPKYAEFLKRFPNTQALAAAPLGEVLKVWQGLGYNRRAKFLHQAAQEVVRSNGGRLPSTEAKLLLLPGIGKATASALMAFAFNKPTTYLETNVRSVYLHYFFRNTKGVGDAELLPLIARAAEGQDSRTWNWALLDYGVYVKTTFGNPNVKSKHYTKQSRFEGSDRQIRGQILRILSDGATQESELLLELGQEAQRVRKILKSLLEEGLISKRRGRLYVG